MAHKKRTKFANKTNKDLPNPNLTFIAALVAKKQTKSKMMKVKRNLVAKPLTSNPAPLQDNTERTCLRQLAPHPFHLLASNRKSGVTRIFCSLSSTRQFSPSNTCSNPKLNKLQIPGTMLYRSAVSARHMVQSGGWLQM